MTRILTFALLLAAAGCGGKDKAAGPTTTTPQPGTGSGAEHQGEDSGAAGEHGKLTPELNAFHDLLAPRWHAAAGAQRIADTCGAIDQFKAAAAAVGKSTPPVATNADTWTTATRALDAAVEDLAAACSAKADAKFEAAFVKVHDAFHKLMRQAKAAGGGDKSGAGPGDQSGQGSAAGSGKATSPDGHDHKH